jgi:Gametolysin peptidase M11
MNPFGRHRFTVVGAVIALNFGLAYFYSARSKLEKFTDSTVPFLAASEPVQTEEPIPETSVAEQSVIASGWQNLSEPTGVAFKNWTERYTKTSGREKTASAAEGISLAVARRERLLQLISQNPEQALAQAVPIAVRNDLPAEIISLLESRVSGVGSVINRLATPRPGQKMTRGHIRHAYVNGKSYQAYTYGRRARISYLTGISLSGIAIENKLAVNDSPVRLLEPGEPIAASGPAAKCDSLVAKAAAVEIEGIKQRVCCRQHLALRSARLTASEGSLPTGAAGPSNARGGPAYAWTHGPKKLLIVRLEFSDDLGDPMGDDGLPLTPARAVNYINGTNKTKAFFESSSYGKTTLQVTPLTAGVSPDVTSLIRMPRTLQSYASAPDPGDVDAMYADAKTLAQPLGYVFDNYDRIIITFSSAGQFSNSNMGFGGLADFPGKTLWLNGSFDLAFWVHELGHTYGLDHASRWIVSDGNPISINGTSDEYGDKFDMMGDGVDSTHDFSPWNKNVLQWLPPTAIKTATQSGIYRVHRFDSAAANLTNTLALKIAHNSSQDYWISYKSATSNSSLENGAYVMWGTNETIMWDQGQHTRGILLDMTTPGDTIDDCALGVGKTFVDTAANVRFKTLSKGGSGADEYLDIQVTFTNSLTAYQTWRNAKFSSSELVDLSISGDLADPDRDGLVNLLEFAWNSAPKTAGRLGSPSHSIMMMNGSRYLTLTFRRQLAVPELTYLPQTSSSLSGTWMSDAIQVGAGINNNDGTETVTYRDSVAQSSAAKRFMRLKVILTP